jgi:protein tyrosine phosphatase
VWQEKCNVIVVITNLVERGKRKCDRYWPESSKTPLTFGNLQVSLTAEMTNANFVHRILSLKPVKSMTVSFPLNTHL